MGRRQPRFGRHVIGANWTPVPRLAVGRNRKEMEFKDGLPQAEVVNCDSWGATYHGIPDGAARGSTSIICPSEKAMLLKLFGHTAFVMNVSLELESYFRSLEPIPWEQNPN